MTEKLRRLEDLSFVGQDWFKEARDMPEGYLQYLDEEADLSHVDLLISSHINEYGKIPPHTDINVAIALHKALRISRRVAADHGFWEYMCIVRFRDYVKQRWADEHGIVHKSRYIYSRRNALSRLWWIAELTCAEDDEKQYDMTKQIMANADVSDRFVWYRFVRTPISATAFANTVARATNDGLLNEKASRDATSLVASRTSNVALEILGRDTIEAVMKEIIDRVQQASGPDNHKHGPAGAAVTVRHHLPLPDEPLC